MLKFLIFWVFVFVAALEANPLKVEFKDEQINNESMLGLRLIVYKDTSIVLRNVKIRYFFYNEVGKTIVVEPSYIAGAKVIQKSLNDSIGFVEIGIDSIASEIFPDKGGFSIGLHYQDWSSLKKLKDPSYLKVSDFSQNEKILVFVNNDLIYGDSESAFIEPQAQFKIVGIQPKGNAWIDIKNDGDFDMLMKGFSLWNFQGNELLLDSIYLKEGEIVRICQNAEDCLQKEKTIVNSSFFDGNVGEVLLKQDSVWVSYLAWGTIGVHAEEAVKHGVWQDVFDFLAEATTDTIDGMQIRQNVFYRYLSLPSDRKFCMKFWTPYSDRDSSSSTKSFPNPIKVTMNKPIVRRLTENDSVQFRWMPVHNAVEYKVIIQDSLKNTIGNIITKNTQINLALSDGVYSWKVYSGMQMDENGVAYSEEGEIVEYDFVTTHLISQGIDTRIWKELPVETIKARKDTRLLNLGYFHKLKEQGWDVSHVDSLWMDSLEDRRCWAVAAELMNHFYGGNITQDEIVFAAQFNESEPLISPFVNNGATSEIADKALKFALNTDEVIRYEGSPSYQTVKKEIDAGKLIYVGVHEHIMVIYGYAGDENNYGFLYAFGDNNGVKSNSAWTNKPIEFYYLMEKIPESVRMSDYRVHYDSDGDGVVNFDEEVRFKTDPFKSDSDDDGIADKKEIYSYAYNPKSPCTNCGEKYDLYYMSDQNKNGIRAELDPDDNGDGFLDGLGVVTGSSKFLDDVPVEYTLFARDHLVINDGVKCFNFTMEDSNFCSIASAGGGNFEYSIDSVVVSLGARAFVGNIDAYLGNYANGIVKLRNAATVAGNINLYAVRNIASLGGELYQAGDFLECQKSAQIQGNIELKKLNDWNLNYTFDSLNTSQQSYFPKKIVVSGETFYLSNGMAYDTLKIESGATLELSPGEMFIKGELQIEAGAIIKFSNPGEQTILNLDGKLKWQGDFSKDIEGSSHQSLVARGFKLILRKSGTTFIEGDFAGTLIAPLSKIVIGQNKKVYYGRIFAKDIVVHQYAKIFRVDFDPVKPLIYVWRSI